MKNLPRLPTLAPPRRVFKATYAQDFTHSVTQADGGMSGVTQLILIVILGIVALVGAVKLAREGNEPAAQPDPRCPAGYTMQSDGYCG